MSSFIKKKSLIILLISLVTIGLVFQIKSDSNYKNELINVEYAPDFQLKKDLTYYSIISKHDENILFFWSRLCPHCEKVIEYIKSNKNYSKVKKYLFTISIDENIEDIKEYSNTFPIYLDYNSKVFKSYNCEHIPSIFIISSKGKIITKSEGGKASIELLDEFINHNN